MLSDKLKEIYLEAEYRLQGLIVMYHRNLISEDELKERYTNTVKELNKDLVVAGNNYIHKELSDDLVKNLDVWTGLNNAKTAIVRTVNSYKMVYNELKKMEAKGEIGKVVILPTLMERCLYRHYAIDTKMVKMFDELWDKYKFEK